MIIVGKFKKTHGIRGEIKIESYFTNKDDLTKYNLFFLEDKTEINLSVFKKKNLLICKILNIESPESASKYVNKFLYIDQKQLPKLKNKLHPPTHKKTLEGHQANMFSHQDHASAFPPRPAPPPLDGWFASRLTPPPQK